MAARAMRAARGVALAAAAVLAAPGGASSAGAPPAALDIALYYGADLPADELRAFDVVVIEPDHGFDPKRLNDGRTEFFAYVSVGETSPSRPYFGRLDPRWKVGENAVWGSAVIDQSQPAWHRFFVDEVIAPLWAQGYRGFFLDTLDSYYLLADADHPWSRQIEGTAALVRAIKARFPEAKLLFNRGFDVIPKVREHVWTVAAESLVRSWNAAESRYVATNPADHAETLERLRAVRDELGLPVLVIDYVPPEDRALARETAARIRALGFKPYVTTPALDAVGIGDIEVQPRKILVVIDEREAPDPHYHGAQRYLATPLNYLGYTPEFVDLRSGLPTTPLVGRYAGVVSWVHAPAEGEANGYADWLKRQIRAGVRVAFLQSFGTSLDAELAALVGVERAARKNGESIRIARRAPVVGFELEPIADPLAVTPVRLASGTDGEALLTVATDAGARFDVAAYTRAGGYVLAPYVVRDVPLGGYARWVVQPLEFVRRALDLAPIPAPDVTTENGRRLLMVHIDGDGFPSRAEVPGTPLAGDYLLTELLQKYRVPTTVSVIEGEISARGAHPALATQMEATARKIFALPHVEAASHSYSHPFTWRRRSDDVPYRKGDTFNLEIPDYRFDLAQEIAGSLDYLDRNLLPPGKKAGLFLWTGDCVIPPEALQAAYAAGVVNMNGGDTLITRSRPSWTLIAPVGIRKSGYYQVFAPTQNENVYTNDWNGPYQGYERVIETFDLTESPIRWKPLSIYYHIYAVTKPASVRALHRIYAYAAKQPSFPVHGSEYARKAIDFSTLSIARDLVRDGWRIRGAGELRTLRLAENAAPPSLAASEGVAGYASGPNALYVHLTGASAFLARAASAAPPGVYLASANGRIERWERRGDTIAATFRSHAPLELELGAASSCDLSRDGRVLTPAAVSVNTKRYVLVDSGSVALAIRCR